MNSTLTELVVIAMLYAGAYSCYKAYKGENGIAIFISLLLITLGVGLSC